MIVSKIKGFKYPDVELVRWFFKEGLDKFKGKVLEFACSNGNNLSLFAGYDYECLGVELDSLNVANANYNFKELFHFEKANFIQADMREFAKDPLRFFKSVEFDVFLIPNCLNYISKEDFKILANESRKNKLFKDNAYFFLRARSTKDHRYGLGKNLKNGSFILENDEFSGEKNLLCTCYNEYELVEICKEFLGLYDFSILTSENINLKDKIFIKDSDIILYGKIRS